MSHVCKRIFKFELQLSSYSQNIKFSRYCPKFHIFTNIVIFQVYLQLFRTTASSLQISWQGHVRNTLFHFCQLPPVKMHNIIFSKKWWQFWDSPQNMLNCGLGCPFSLKGVLHLLPKISMFCALSQDNQQLFEK